MLYVFHVDTGAMITFEMDMAVQSVVYLKQQIERKSGVEASAQVLLVSGGEVLQNDTKVALYSAGTDTNPIFMFSKAVKEDKQRPPPMMPDATLEIDFRMEAENCCSMPSSLNTIITCAGLAKRMMNNAHDLARSCEDVVHQQHLQHQGWAAVVANMEDITDEFRARAADFNDRFKDHRKRKEEYNEFLSRFSEDLELLASIPILPALRLNAASNPFTAFDELHADSDTFEAEDTSDEHPDSDPSSEAQQYRMHRQRDREALTLLHWITARENQDSLKQIAEYCAKGLELLESDTMENLRLEIAHVLEGTVLGRVKQIKGLEDRLYGLDQLMSETKKIEQEQQDLAQAFVQNQQRASELGDASVMAPLCASHRRQLLAMLNNQSRLADIRRRCIRAKYELASNLDSRLGWIVYIENRMFDIDSKMMFYNRWLARLRRHFSVVEQLHRAPALFVAAVREVVRRRTFSQAFIAWASDLACHLLTIHNEEVMRRREFGARFSGHFLTGLFPGTDDLPPPFGTQAPRVFDASLPKLTGKDVEIVDEKMPEISNNLPRYDMTHVTNFFVSRSGNPAKTEEKLRAAEEPITPVTAKDGTQDRGCESETDTEEFEKVSQSSPSGLRRGGALRGSIRGSTGRGESRGRGPVFYVGDTPPSSPERSPRLTQEELDLLKQEIAKYKGILALTAEQCNKSLVFLRDDIGNLKLETLRQKDEMAVEFSAVTDKWQICNSEMALRHREMMQRLTVDHELEMNDMKQLLDAKVDEICTLKMDNVKLQSSCDEKIKDIDFARKGLTENLEELRNLCKILETKLVEAEVIKQKEIKELQDKMAHECKTELESLRSRFRLVALTSMDRSPSESSLEKIERPDMIEISNHKQILQQTREDFEIEKEEAVRRALDEQEQTLKEKMVADLELLKMKTEADKQVHLNDAVRRIIDEKDRQLEHFREREMTLIKESNKYKETIRQLTDPETTDFQSMTVLKERVNTLENEKIHLESEVEHLRITSKEKRVKGRNICDVSTQLNPITSSVTTQQSSESKSSSTMTESEVCRTIPWRNTGISTVPGLSLSNCGPGDIVLLIWDTYHLNYTVLQESTTLYFVHADSLPGLNLKGNLKDESKRKFHCIAQVESKVYCYAKKNDNRYRVEKGTCFYQVKVKPPPSMSQSVAVPGPAHQTDNPIERDMSQSESVMAMSTSAVSNVIKDVPSKHQRMVRSAIVIQGQSSKASLAGAPPNSEQILEQMSPSKLHFQEAHDSIETFVTAPLDKRESASKIVLASEEKPTEVVTVTSPVKESPKPGNINSPPAVSNIDGTQMSEEHLESEVAEEATP